MRTPTRITTIVAAGAVAVASTAAVASAARQTDPACDGTGAGTAQPGGRQATGQQGGQQGGQQARGMRQRRHGRQGKRSLPTRTSTAPLTAAESSAITYMREEEKLARDVYRKLAGTSGNAVFTRIAASEQRHMDALGRLIARYRLTDPTKGNAAGVFKNPELQRLYDELVARGSASPAAAIQVGLDIERLDIADLQDRKATVKHTDVRWVFQQLERGSNNHLRAFTTQAG